MNKQMRDLLVVAEQGDANAQHQLGAIYLACITSVTYHSQAVEWLTKAASQGHVEAEQLLGRAYFELGRAYYTHGKEGREPSKAVAMLMKAIDHHYTHAYRALATIYTLGAKGFDKCLETAITMLKEGAVLGDLACQYELGRTTLKNSRNINDQYAIDGIQWLTIAAAQGHRGAQTQLSDIYKDNEYAKPDNHMAIFWYSKAQVNQ